MYKWRYVVEDDKNAIRAFIEPKEAYCTSFTDKALDSNGNIIKKSIFNNKNLYVYADKNLNIGMLVLFSGNTTIPVFNDDIEKKEISRLLKSVFVRNYSPNVCLGANDHVKALEWALHWNPSISIDYDTMFLSRNAILPDISLPYECRKATMADLQALLPIAAEYDKSEVMTHLHTFNMAACKAHQAQAIRDRHVYIVVDNGKVIARAQTNAHGFSHEQLGGIYVLPEYRRYGLGRYVVLALISDIIGRNKNVSLFVKKVNVPAQNLYKSLGFCSTRDFCVSYFV